ncbi:MAG: PAS domain S-box protein [Candidatus Binatia bacterium]
MKRDSLHDLQVADARWQAVLATARDAIIAIDTQGCITLFNPSAEQVFGYRAEEVVGHNVKLLMPQPYRDEHDEYLRRYQHTGEARAIGRIRSVQGRRKTGEVFPMELSVAEAHLDEEVLYIAILRDTSERHATEAALRFERDFAERLIDTAQIGVLVLDPSGRIERYNAFLEQLSGYPLATVRGRDGVTTLIAERDRPRMRNFCVQAIRAGQLRGQMASLVSATGHERQIEWNIKPLLDGNGQLVGLLCMGDDITDRLSAQRELRELQRAAQERARLADVGAVTAKIVHDFGNPLAALSMQAQLILRRARRGDFHPVAPVSEPAEQILRTLRRLETLVREFTDFARDQRPMVRTIQVVPFLASCVEIWQALAADRGISVVLADMDEVPDLRGDEVLLRRVMDNLIKNAIEAVDGRQGQVMVWAQIPAAGKICIAVEDNGPGIPDGLDVFRLFETTKADGTGIGLAVAKELISAHGGTIEHAPRAQGGTVFRIQLPIAGPALHDSARYV